MALWTIECADAMGKYFAHVVAKSRRREYLHVPLHCPQEPAIPRRRADDEAKKSMFCTILLEYVTLVNVAALGGHSSLSIYLYTVPYMYM